MNNIDGELLELAKSFKDSVVKQQLIVLLLYSNSANDEELDYISKELNTIIEHVKGE